jgi:MFS family permease
MCGASKHFTIMLIGRCIQGSGAGGILTLTEALITDLIPLRQRGNYFALIGIVWALGSVSGMRFNPTVNPHH